MTEPVQIGLKEVYDSVKELSGFVASFVTEQKVEVAKLQKDVQALKDEREQKWKLNLALVSAGCSMITAILVPLIVR